MPADDAAAAEQAARWMGMLGMLYRLIGREAVPCGFDEWDALMNDIDARRVAETHIGDTRVSTVFHGVNRQIEEGEPLVFETRVFGASYWLDGRQWYCSTWEQAVALHESACALVRICGASWRRSEVAHERCRGH